MSAEGPPYPFADCPHRAQQPCGYLNKRGFDKNGKQRYWCRLRKRSFNESAAGPFYRLRTPPEKVRRATELHQEGVSNRKIADRLGVRPHTVGRWLRLTAKSP